MKLGTLSKRIIVKRVLLVIFLIYIGWFLKARLTPSMPMMGAGAGAEPLVVTKPVESTDISPFKKYIGVVEAVKSVDLRPQITGYVERVLFKEGSFIQQDDLLFIIEQERYIANLELRSAELKKAEAHLFQVEKEYKRQVSLNKQKYASEAKLENAESDLLQAKASVKQAKANLDLAKIDLGYTEIKAPISGYIGKALVTEGNYVNSSSQILARIVQTSPIRIGFSTSDKDYLNARKFLQNKDAELNTKLVLPNGDTLSASPTSHFSNNEINKDTATMAVYLEYENKDNMLIPGNYINVLVSENRADMVTLIPQAAIGQDEHGNYAFVINQDNIAEQKRIVLDGTFEGKQIVNEGLTPGEQVVVGGIQKVKDGIKVRTAEIKE